MGSGSGRRSRSRERHRSKRRHRRYSTSTSVSLSSASSDVHSRSRYKKSKRTHRKEKENLRRQCKRNKKSVLNKTHGCSHNRSCTVTPPLPLAPQFSNSQFSHSSGPNLSSQSVINNFQTLRNDGSGHNSNNLLMPTQAFSSHINVIPEFDPSDNSQNIESWIHKVNECAQIYSWNEKQTCHYALTKLTGLAKRWYQGLPTLLFTWDQWVDKLKLAFPSTENYGDLLQRMLQLRCKIGQALDVYYYEKMILINKCEITGRKAVGCLVHGIDDKFVRMSANASRFDEPEQLYSYIKTLAQSDSSSNLVYKRQTMLNKNTSQTQDTEPLRKIVCYNCGEPGHIRTRCTKPMKKCNICRRVGHLAKDCRNKVFPVANSSNNVQDIDLNKFQTDVPTQNNVMRITSTSADNNFKLQTNKTNAGKYYKEIQIEHSSKIAFIDLGSNCCLLKESLAKEIYGSYNKCNHNLSNLRGFGNSSVRPLGSVNGNIIVDEIIAKVNLIVIPDHYMPCDIIIGQTFTELPNIVMYKTSDTLIFYEAPNFDGETVYIKTKLNSLVNFTLDGCVTSPVEVVTDSDFSGSLYVPTGFHDCFSKKYMILPGIYKFDNNKGFIMVSNLGKTKLNIDKGCTLARGVEYEEVKEEYVGVIDASALYEEPLTLGDINIGTRLSESELQSFNQLLIKYRDCFALDLSELGKTNLTEMVIKLKDDTPVVYNPYRMSLKEKECLSEIIEDLLKNGIIRESSSSYASPIILVNKKNGQKRLCVDYRALNRKTLKDKYPLPRIEDKLDYLGGNNFFSCLDLASGYYQVPVAEESKHLTAFITPDGLYEYNRMPFGLANAPSIFQRAINTMLNGVSQKLALAYMDDLLVPSKTIQEGFDRLESIFILLRNAKLTLNLKKCAFFQEKIDYLGYEISSEGVRPGTNKIEAVKRFPIPKNVHEVRQFVGLASYFRKFVQNFSIIARPLTLLTKKNEPWRFGPEQMKAFNTLKEKLIDRPILALFDPAAQLEVHTDACKLGVGAILLQNSNTGLQPIAYYSRQTSPEEQRFHSYELETLAVITALRRFRVYLLGTTFKVVTDCNAIKSTMTKKDLIPRVARWWIAMQEFDFIVEYRSGSKMTHVDALSRNPIDAENPPSRDDDCHVFKIVMDVAKVDVEDERWLQTVQQADTELQRITNILQDPDSTNIVELKANFTVKNDKLYRIVKKKDSVRLLWVVPKSVRWQIVRSNHDEVGHFGFDKTYDRIRKVYWFKNMRRFIKKYCKSCLHCAHNKLPGGPKEGLLHPIPKPNKPFDVLHADHCGPFPQSKKRNCFILAIIDSFTKFIYIKPVRNCKSKTSIAVFEEYFSIFGVPRRLITDRGTSFTSREFTNFVKEKGICHILNAVATPRANGQIERYNRSIVDSLTALNNNRPDNEWDVMIPRVQWGLNNTVNKTTSKTPSEVLFGFTPTGVSDGAMNSVVSANHEFEDRDSIRSEVSERIVQSQKMQKERFDKKRKPAYVYKVGDLVRVEREISNAAPGQSKKLLPKCSGPYRIVEVLENDRYVIEDTPITKKPGKPLYRATFAVDKIHPWLVFSNDLIGSDTDDSET